MTGGRDILLADAILRGGQPTFDARDWWRGAVFYQVYLRSFRDSNGDGIGDLRGVIEKLDYIQGLGVDGIWLAPFYLSPQKDFGYDVSDLRAIDPRFGTIEDLLELIEGAHDRGMRVLADFIPCHTSDEHKWFRDSRASQDNDHADWYVWADASADGTPPNNWLSSFGGPAWTWEPRRSQYYYHPFLTCQPALNLRNEETLQAVIDAMAYWRDLGIDGFRLDAVQCLCWDEALRSNPARVTQTDDVALGGGPNNPFARQEHLFDRDLPFGMSIIERFRKELTDGHPEFALIGELADVDTSRLAVKYTGGQDRLHAVYDFDLIHKGKSIRRWVETLRVRSRFINSGWLLNVMTNHDSERAVSNLTKFAEDAGQRDAGAKLLLFLQATLRGGAIVFQGEELGLPQPKLDFEDLQDPWGINLYPDFAGRDGVRTPFPWRHDLKRGGFTDGKSSWLPIPKEHLPLAVDKQEHDENSVLSFFRALMAWRKEHAFLRWGGEVVCDADTVPIIAIERRGDNRAITFLANFSLEERFYPCPGKLIAFPHSTARQDAKGIHLPGLSFAATSAG
ncbi:alpha-amylase family glycosyl hydrolase [Pontivivens nitratireducens]|uniref:alpha-amylase family glycosyl hydrolase n=1 Tax=Pontivivens nitratireducens TaxID=2758038 RepID=UPI001C8D3E0B|nr:alpha-amylase family glycosyl hydrolase [Pontibrevibacter nitratireducens]